MLKLYKEGKSPIEVAVITGSTSDETGDLYLGYLRLIKLHHLVLIYKADLIREAKQIPFLRILSGISRMQILIWKSKEKE